MRCGLFSPNEKFRHADNCRAPLGWTGEGTCSYAISC
jgi:hypothetical protein